MGWWIEGGRGPSSPSTLVSHKAVRGEVSPTAPVSCLGQHCLCSLRNERMGSLRGVAAWAQVLVATGL